MPLKIYNTLSHHLEEFIPGGTKKEDESEYPPVTIYSCGPTVYSYAHIGNFRTFVFNDLLRRYLKFRGYSVVHAMNITDVDDKTISGAQEAKVTLSEFTEKFSDLFFEDLQTLNIEQVEHIPRATESIDAMIDIMQSLKKKDIMYEKEGSQYFSIGKFKEYGRLSNLENREIKTGLRYDTDEYEKDDVRDFALWKASRDDEPSWETPFGAGRPGWHIECSAMVRKIFGSTIDIHTGGVDLIFPHHENEIAQSEAAYTEQFVRYWIHAEHLQVEGSKMSKSAGNFYTLRDLLAKGHPARAIRYLLLSAHYRKQLNFTFDGLKQAEQALSRIDNLLIRCNEVTQPGAVVQDVENAVQKFNEKFIEAMDDDLNTSGALGHFFEFLHEINVLIDAARLSTEGQSLVIETLKKADSVFGFIFFPIEEEDTDAEKIDSLIQERFEAKKEKDFARADEIRDMLINDGIILEDTKDGTRWKRKK